MLTIFVLFVGLTLATAVIAYWSDNLGKKLGKKRVSLWGMRPRTTATFLTIASSWLIMLFTLCVMLVIFPPLRRSLLRYDEVKAAEGTLKISKAQLEGQLVKLNAQTNDLGQQVARASSKLAKVQTQLNQSRSAAEQARKSRDQAQKDASQARKNADEATKRQREAVKNEQAARDNLKDVRGQLGATSKQREVAERQLGVAQTNLKKADADVKSANAQVKNADTKLGIANTKVANAVAQLDKVRTDLTEAQKNEDEANKNANLAEKRAKDARKSAIESGKAAIESGRQVILAQKKMDALEEQSKKLIEDNRALLAENENFAAISEKVAGDNVVLLSNGVRVPVKTVLAAKNFAQGTSVYQARNDLHALFERADEIVRGYQDGNKTVPPLLPGAKLTLPALRAPVFALDGSPTGEYVPVEGNDIFEELAKAISSSQDPLSVRLVSERNYLLGDETLSARFIFVPNSSALPANELLVSARIDGAANDAVVFNKLSELADTARDVATDAGVAPPLWRDSRNFYAPGSNEQVFDTLRQIKAINGPARVSIVTARPISTADLLSVRFEVEPVSSVTTQATARMAPRK